MSRELRSADIAKANGIDRKTAYRWMKEIHEVYGPSVVCRRGKRGIYVTTEDAFAKVAAIVREQAVKERRVRDLEERVEDAEKRLDKQAQEIAEFRRKAAAWFARGQR